ncbi:MAG: sugar phosphate isomerase/epimerase [Anaerolineae bacterium]|nr:sugar phosphate isomerase/epimerase [Anaerolineae bacterium]
MKTAICNDTFQDWDFERVCWLVAEVGYDGVEIAPWTFADSVCDITSGQRRRIRSIAEGTGLEVVGLHTVTRGPEGIYLNHSDPSIRARTSAYLRSLADFCGDVGGSIIVLGSAKHRNVLPGLSPVEAWGYAVDTLAGALDRAAERGVTFCLEPLSHTLTDFLTRAAEALQMVEEVSHPNLQMMLDVRSASHDEAPIPDLIRRSGRHLAHFHANDDNGRGPGMGGADYAAIASALREVGYSRYLSVEVFDFSPDPETIARESVAQLRRYFGAGTIG